MPGPAAQPSPSSATNADQPITEDRDNWLDLYDRFRIDLTEISAWCQKDSTVERTTLALRSIRHGLTSVTARHFHDSDSLRRFVDLLENFVNCFVERIPARETRGDIESLFKAVRMDLDEVMAARLQGRAMDEFERCLAKTTGQMLLFLQEVLQQRREAIPEDVSRAFREAIEQLWNEHNSARKVIWFEERSRKKAVTVILLSIVFAISCGFAWNFNSELAVGLGVVSAAFGVDSLRRVLGY